MDTEQAAVTDSRTVASDNYNETISWADWRNLLTQKDEDEIALAVGMILPDGSWNVTEATVRGFNARCDFRRSMKLFHVYAKQVNA